MDLSKLKEDSEGVKMLLKDIFSSNKVLVDARGSDSYCEITVNRNLYILPSKDGFVSFSGNRKWIIYVGEKKFS